LATIGVDTPLSKGSIFDRYERSVSVILIITRLKSIIKNYSEKNLFKEFNLSFSGFVVMRLIWVWGDLETAKLAKNAGIAKSTLTGILKHLRNMVTVKESLTQMMLEKLLFILLRLERS